MHKLNQYRVNDETSEFSGLSTPGIRRNALKLNHFGQLSGIRPSGVTKFKSRIVPPRKFGALKTDTTPYSFIATPKITNFPLRGLPVNSKDDSDSLEPEPLEADSLETVNPQFYSTRNHNRLPQISPIAQSLIGRRSSRPASYRQAQSSFGDSMLLSTPPQEFFQPEKAAVQSFSILPEQKNTFTRVGNQDVEVKNIIGCGGYSKVYACRDTTHGKEYALKTVNLRRIDQNEIKLNLMAEVKLLESLIGVDHVVQLVSCSTSDTEIKMLMELGEGDLSKILAAISEAAKPFDVDFVRYWGGQVLKAVATVHSHNIVHSDLKPANFLVVNGALKLCDFGIADRVPENSTSVQRGIAVGTRMYMAPETMKMHCITELANDDAVYKVAKASDVWSCGVILYEMVYQKSPVADFFNQGGNRDLEDYEIQYSKVAPGHSPVPLVLHEVISECLRPKAKDRISAQHALDSLFFTPVSIDFKAILSISRNAYSLGISSVEKADTSKKELPSIEDQARMLYSKLIHMNKGK